MAAEDVVAIAVVIAEGGITGDVGFGTGDCDAESNKCEVRTTSIHTSIAMVSTVFSGSIRLL